MNLRLGFALLRDARVPLLTKLFVLGLGAAVTGLIEVLELPIESVLAALLPMIGVTGDLVVDGAEAIIGPMVVACVLLPHFAPPAVVASVRSQQNGFSATAR
jgi:hypothetical protein